MIFGWNPLTKFKRDETAGITVFAAVMLPVLLLIMAFVIDLNLARFEGNRLQIAADSAALAGASQLPNDGDAILAALEYSDKNREDVYGHPVLMAADIDTGNWDGTTFVAGGVPKNAVRVVTRRSDVNSNPLAAIFSGLAGIENFQLGRIAVARSGPGVSCQSGGFYTEGEVISGSNNIYVSNFCLYGEEGVKIGSDNEFGGGTEIGMSDLDDFQEGGNNEGVDNALHETEKDLVLVALVSGIISDMSEPILTGMPDYITNGPVELDEITDSTSLLPNTLYIVDGVVDFGSDANVADIAIVADGEIKVGSNSTLENVVFASNNKILIGSDVVMGVADFCDVGTYGIYLFSEDNIEMGSNNTLQGVQMAAKGDLKLSSDVGILAGVYGEAVGNIEYGSADSFTGCEGGLESLFGGTLSVAGPGYLALVK